jgi:hypothetical protein
MMRYRVDYNDIQASEYMILKFYTSSGLASKSKTPINKVQPLKLIRHGGDEPRIST